MMMCLDCLAGFANDCEECPRCGSERMVSVNEDAGKER